MGISTATAQARTGMVTTMANIMYTGSASHGTKL